MTIKEFQAQLIEAGAGTGKTEKLIEKVYKLFQDKNFRSENKGRDPRLIVCTFTRKASQELKERLLNKAVQEAKKRDTLQNPSAFLNYVQSPSLHISTIDSVLNLFLKRYGHHFDLSPDFQIQDNSVDTTLFNSMAEKFIFEKNFSLLKRLPYFYLKQLFLFYFECCLKYDEISFYNLKDFEEFNYERDLFLSAESLLQKKKGVPRNFYKIKKYFYDKGSRLADFLNDDEDIIKFKGIFKEDVIFDASLFVPLFEELARAGKELFPLFMEEKKNSAILSINDVLLFSLALLRERPETAQEFNREWDYWLIDEYQDTSWVQEQIIQRVTNFNNVFCVGDPGQSIYFFRSADPEVFGRRKKSIGDPIQKLKINRRSQASLVYFYNEFFQDNDVFIKFKPLDEQSIQKNESCVHFITYEKPKNSKEEYKEPALQALCVYIQKLKSQGFAINEIAILSSRNADLETAASYLRRQGLPVLLYSSKNFAKKQLIRDALFLLKFLINPYDDSNLKALLRTPYFRMSDQELADSSQNYRKFNSSFKPNPTDQKGKISFWMFIKQKFPDQKIIQSLDDFLNLKNKQGYVKTFEQALLNCGLMELSYFQDPTGSIESSLWKLLYLLNEDSSSALKCFYALMERDEGEEDQNTEPPSCGGGNAIQLMTIHNSKGLEFEHVILMDFSIMKSSLQSGNQVGADMIYEESIEKAAFSIPEGRRDSQKKKSYGHEMYNKSRQEKTLEEKDRLYYVAMTRAKQSLAVFIPNTVPDKNSWLSRQSFFKAFSVSGRALLSINDDKIKQKMTSWRLNPGHYKTSRYSFYVESSESFYEEQEECTGKSWQKSSSFSDSKKEDAGQLNVQIQVFDKDEKASQSASFENLSSSKSKEKKTKTQKQNCDKDSPHTVPATGSVKIKSSEDFVRYILEKKTTDAQNFSDIEGSKEDWSDHKNLHRQKKSDDKTFLDKNSSDKKAVHEIRRINLKASSKKKYFQKKRNLFYSPQMKNILLKRNLGNHLHFFLQKLSHQSFETVQPVIEKSFLPLDKRRQIQKAVLYVAQLKKPDMSYFLKTGFSEWPFKIQRQNTVLQGQIDLWAWDSKEIHIFDYKSSLSLSQTAQKQLVFYSWILNEFYHPQKIWMYEVYPIEETLKEKTLYSESDKTEVEDWLNNLEISSMDISH